MKIVSYAVQSGSGFLMSWPDNDPMPTMTSDPICAKRMSRTDAEMNVLFFEALGFDANIFEVIHGKLEK